MSGDQHATTAEEDDRIGGPEWDVKRHESWEEEQPQRQHDACQGDSDRLPTPEPNEASLLFRQVPYRAAKIAPDSCDEGVCDREENGEFDKRYEVHYARCLDISRSCPQIAPKEERNGTDTDGGAAEHCRWQAMNSVARQTISRFASLHL